MWAIASTPGTTSCQKAGWIIREWKSQNLEANSQSRNLMVKLSWRAIYVATYTKSTGPLHHPPPTMTLHSQPSYSPISTYGMPALAILASKAYTTSTNITLSLGWIYKEMGTYLCVMAVPRASTTKHHFPPLPQIEPKRASDASIWTYRAPLKHLFRGTPTLLASLMTTVEKAGRSSYGTRMKPPPSSKP